MDDTQRRVDAIRKDRSELENHIIDEYAAGKITRREFVRRGTVVGMSIPLVSFLAAACGGGGESGTAGDRRRHGHRRGSSRAATSAWRSSNHRPSRIPSSSRTRAEPGCSARPASSSPSRTRNSSSSRDSPRAGSRTRTARSGRSRFARASRSTAVRRLTANDVKTTFETLVDPKNASQRALRARRRPLAGEHRGTRRRDRRLPPRRAERQLPHARQLGQLQRDHHPGRPRSGRLGEDVRGHRALQARELHAEGRREVRPQRRLLGREGQPGRVRAQVLRRRRPDDPRYPGRRGRLRRALLGLGRSRRS